MYVYFILSSLRFDHPVTLSILGNVICVRSELLLLSDSIQLTKCYIRMENAVKNPLNE